MNFMNELKLSLVNILENVFVFIEILFKMLLFKGGVLIYAEHCTLIFNGVIYAHKGCIYFIKMQKKTVIL